MTKKHPKKGNGRFAGIPHAVLKHDDYINLSGNAVKLLVEAAKAYNGYNNGDICLSWSLMSKRGFNSQATLSRALKELVEKNLLIMSRQGGRAYCSLYAVTWQPVNECNNKITEIYPNTTAPRKFKSN